ncbi:MAG: hydrogenase formation protein HypD [Spirochaetales bacterium]|nr:hydrogenase formation protein HypD [Spirochaetales bacterium]
MKEIMGINDRYSDPSVAAGLVKKIEEISDTLSRQVRLMEVCGTHTVALRRAGIHSLLPAKVKLISGPGCPVCVTPSGYIDNAFRLIEKHNCRVASFGDMVKVPGSDGRTLSAHTGSGRIKVIYSPSELSALAAETTEAVVFLAIGFETTIPAAISGFRKALEEGRKNLFLYTAFKTVPPALQFLLSDESHMLDGFLLPGHVSVIIGREAYGFLERKNGIPGVITGFEPIDMLIGIETLLKLIRVGDARVVNAYKRAVREGGNPAARALMYDFLEPYAAHWRSLGIINDSGLRLSSRYRDFDAASVFSLAEETDAGAPGCLCGAVIQGKVTPADCGLFGKACTPDRPVGPCMVSSEGTCAAYFRYGF